MRIARPRWARPALLVAMLAAATPALGALPKVPEGFKIRLVAAVPAVTFPCQLATRPDGGLFVAEDPMDQVGPYEADNGRILLFRDGKDPVVFAEGFRAIFGMAWHDGALYVMNMPRLTVLRDTNGDGKADQQNELFTDLGPKPRPGGLNDHIVSGLQFGMDGWLYISVGDKGVPGVHGPDGRTAQLKGGGTMRCRPDGTGIEVISTGTRNHLEPNLDARDNLFTYDNTDDGDGWWTRVTHHIDGGHYGYPYDYHAQKDRMLDRMAEYGGGSPCGGVLYKEDAWPEKYRGLGLWAEWGKGHVAAIRFQPNGASFKVAEYMKLVEKDDGGEFRPIDLALSYDGKTLYIADWNMGGWGTKTEKVGRVFAMTYEGKVETKPRGKDSDPIEAQIKALAHPSFNERMRAETALIKKGREALAPVKAALRSPTVDPVGGRHLVWAYDTLAGESPEAVGVISSCLHSQHADIRARPPGRWDSGPRSRPPMRSAGRRRATPIPPSGSRRSSRWAGSATPPRPRLSCRRWPTPTPTSPSRRGSRCAGSAAGISCRSGSTTRRSASASSPRWKGSTTSRRSDCSRDLWAIANDRRPSVPGPSPISSRPTARRPPGTAPGGAPGRRRASPRPSRSRGRGRRSSFERLRDALADPDVPVRLAAVDAVKEANDREALPVLRHRFPIEPDEKVRREIAAVFGAMDDRAALPLLISALRHASVPESVREASLASIEAIGTDAAIAALVDLLHEPGLKPDRQARLIASLGRFKARAAVPTVVAMLSNPDPKVRAAAAEALGKIGDTSATPKVRPLLKDDSPDVRKAAIAAVAALKDRESIPALILAAESEPTRYEATIALASMPDIRSLHIHLTGLGDKSPDVRKASSSALMAIRDEARPALERLAGRKELPPSALPELRKIYGAIQPIAEWKVVGPFKANERPPFPLNRPVDTAKPIAHDGKPLAWKSVKADGAEGEVDVNRLYPGGDHRSVFAYAEVDSPTARPARMAVGSDDTAQVWVNGKSVFRHDGDRGFTAAQDEFDINLVKGKNRIVLRSGNTSGNWQFSAGVSASDDHAFLQGPTSGGFDPDKFRAEALKGKGKAERGKALFSDLKGVACLKCHAVGGQGGAVGPELGGVGVKYPREELITSVLYPSQRISSGYEPVVLATADGRTLTGIIKSETPEAIEIEDAEAKRIKLAKTDLDGRKTSDVSLMPNGLAEGLTPNDFADLIAYLETLKDTSALHGPGAAGPAKPGGR